MTPLVFLHGAASTPDVWARQHRTFPRALYLPLQDPGVPAGQLLAAYADRVAVAIEDPASVVVGHSLGGAVALLLALSHPGRVGGVVLVGSAPHLPVNSALLDGLQSEPGRMLVRLADWSLARAADPRLRDRGRALMTAADPELAWRQFSACAAFDVRDQLVHLAVPVAAIVGAEDRMTPPALVQEISLAVPGAAIRVVANAGHLVMLEQPDAFNQALWDILKTWGLSRS
jgi:pimeloyl-ACP methyl ester carboxylesterase